MPSAALTTQRVTISRRASEIRAAWSTRQRRQRATEGRRRFEELLRLIVGLDCDCEVWAVGALAFVDLQRIAP